MNLVTAMATAMAAVAATNVATAARLLPSAGEQGHDSNILSKTQQIPHQA
jgi:hypothetical protein